MGCDVGPFLKPLTFPLWWFLGRGRGGQGRKAVSHGMRTTGSAAPAGWLHTVSMARPADCLFYSLG